MKKLDFLLLIPAVCLALVSIGFASVQWEYTGLAADYRYVCGIAFRAGDSDTAFTLICDSGIYRSVDGGQTWTFLVNLWYAAYLEVDPINRDYAYVACDTALYRTSDGGETWVAMDTDSLFPGENASSGLGVNPCHPETLYLATSDVSGSGALYRSSDSGYTWGQVDLPWEWVRPAVIGMDPVQCGRMFMTLDWGGPLVRSRDSGNTWDTTGHAGYADDLAFDPVTPDLMYMCFRGDLYLSRDAGDTWERRDSEHGITEWVGLVEVNPVYPNVIYTGAASLYRSEDYGETWTEFTEGLPGLPEDTRVKRIAVDGEFGDIILVAVQAGSYCHGIFRRTESWAGAPPAMADDDGCALALSLFPNPFTDNVAVSCRFWHAAYADLNVYDTEGRMVRHLDCNELNAGTVSAIWDGRDWAGHLKSPGVYFIEAKAGDARAVRPVVFLR
jgi:photosystem II stability/assembly factor-like uncharacterized protein